MKKLTKVFLIAILVAFATESFAQVNFGVKGGLNIAKEIEKYVGDGDYDGDLNEHTKSKLGFQVGPVVEFGFSDLISLETGLLLSTKGYKYKWSDDGTEAKGSINIIYLNIPVNARVGFDVGGMRIYGAAGPYVSYALYGSYKRELTDSGYTDSHSGDVEIGNDEEESDMKPLDYGLSIGAGAVFGAFEVGLNYDYGLADLGFSEDFKRSNRCFSITAAYKFGK